MDAVAVKSMCVVRTTRREREYFFIEVELRLADDSLKRLRRHFPTRAIADLVKADLATRADHVVECFNRGVEWTRSETVNAAYREWITTLTIDQRIDFAQQKHSPSSELDPEITDFLESRRQESQQRKTDRRRTRRVKAEPRERRVKGNKPSVAVYAKGNRFVVSLEKRTSGVLERLRCSYPTRELAQRAKQQLLEKPEYAAECLRTKVRWVDSEEIQNAIAVHESQIQSERQRERESREAERLAETREKQAQLRAQRQAETAQRRAVQELARQEKIEAERIAREKRTSPEEVAAAKKRDQEAQERRDERRRGRQAERKANLAAAQERARQHKARKRVDAAEQRKQRLARKAEIRQQIVDRGIAERQERRQYQLDRQAGVLDFVGAESLLAFREEGLLETEEVRALARLDADPEVILRALRQSRSQGTALRVVAQELVQSFESIPPNEDITRFALRDSCQRCRQEFAQVKNGHLLRSKSCLLRTPFSRSEKTWNN